MNDAARWVQEGIPYPDLIVVSGDIVQGAKADQEDADKIIADQYDEATEFLTELATEIVDSDHSRVVIVPGNHDVNWRRARQAMHPLAECPYEIEIESMSANSNLRWSWRDAMAYEVTDTEHYESRFEQFRDFQTGFYSGLQPDPLHIDHDIVFVEPPSLDLAIVGFASWYGNDCFCRVGEINPASLSKTRRLLMSSNKSVRMAVWHHSVDGGPRNNDYMDRRVIHKVVDMEFGVVLHGHQHSPYAISEEVPMPHQQSIAVVSAGSLAVGDSELPMGEKRQFNIIDMDPDEETITIHVRGMSPSGVFTASHRDDFGGDTFKTLKFPRRRIDTTANSINEPIGEEIVRLDDAFRAIENGRYQDALLMIAEDSGLRIRERRQVLIAAFEGLGRHDDLLAILDRPQNTDESVKLISLLIENEQFEKAETTLQDNLDSIDSATAASLMGTIAARRMIG